VKHPGLGPLCTELCRYPCAKDHRTTRQKIEARLAPNSGVSEAERQIAREQLARMTPVPPRRTNVRSTDRPLTREDILRATEAMNDLDATFKRTAQAAKVSEEDLRAAFEYFRGNPSARPPKRAKPLDAAPPPRYRDGKKIRGAFFDEFLDNDVDLEAEDDPFDVAFGRDRTARVTMEMDEKGEFKVKDVRFE